MCGRNVICAVRHGQALLPQRKGDLCHVGGGGGFYLVFTMAIASGLLYTIHRWLTCGNVGKKFKPFVRRLQKWGKIDGTGCIGKLFRRWVELKETSTFWDDLPACGPVFHYFLLSRTRETITAPNASKPQKFPQTFFSSWNGGDLQTGLALGLWPQLRWQQRGLALLRLQAPEGLRQCLKSDEKRSPISKHGESFNMGTYIDCLCFWVFKALADTGKCGLLPLREPCFWEFPLVLCFTRSINKRVCFFGGMPGHGRPPKMPQLFFT